MHYIGLMSGTSVDGIDAAVTSVNTSGQVALDAVHQHPIPKEVANRIHALCAPGNNELDRAGQLDVELGRLFADAVNALLRSAGLHARNIRAIGSHGQTVRHRPGGTCAYTVQLGNPSVIAEHTGITTVADFRMRDMAAGGQGAPLVPAFHRAQFHAEGIHRAIVNIGGIANITYLPSDGTQPVLGFDTGPGNTLLDQWVAHHHQKTHDADGAWAAGGTVLPALLSRLHADDYFALPPPKSTGRERFNLAWLERALEECRGAAAADVQATLAELTAEAVVRGINTLPACDEVYLCGGGYHNRDLVDRVGRHLNGVPMHSTDALGIHPDWVEAAAFAWLAHRTMEGLPGNVPSVTGASKAVILGGIYRASGREPAKR